MAASDDPSIEDKDTLLRRISNSRNHLVYDHTEGCWTLSSGGFALHDDGVSMYLTSTLAELSQSAADVAATRQGDLVAEVHVGAVRANDCGVQRDPVEPPTKPIDPAHALITFDQGLSRNARKNRVREIVRHAWICHGTVSLPPPAP